MKKIYKSILLLLVAILVLPTVSLLVGCGATPSHEAQGVSFVSTKHDDNGLAVFELDLNKSINLPYKLNPSSAYGYAPRFTALTGINTDNTQNFNLNFATGEFCITSDEFKDVKVRINIGDFSDECWIKLKKYPTAIGVYDKTAFNSINQTPKISMATGSSYQINVAGIFEDSQIINAETGEKTPSLLSDNDYNFLVEPDSLSKTLINVPSSARLNIMAYNNYGTAKVKVSLCDYNYNVIVDEEENELSFSIEIDVYVICSSMDINLSGADYIVSSKNNDNVLSISSSNLTYNEEMNIYTINFDVDFYDRYNRLIEDEKLRVRCFSSDQTYVEVDNENAKILITKPQYNTSLNFKLEVWSNAALISGEFCVVDIEINISF